MIGTLVFRVYILIIISVFIFTDSYTQEFSQRHQVEILNADRLKYLQTDDVSLRILAGNVRLKQDSVLMFCDSAVIRSDTRQVDAFGHVSIQQDKDTKVYADYLSYDGNKKIAKLTKNVRLIDKNSILTTSTLFYDLSIKVAYYLKGATIVDKGTHIKSRRGYYYTQNRDAFFSDSVVVMDTSFILRTDTLQYNMTTKKSFFYDRTEIKDDSSTIICYTGLYDAKNEQGYFGTGTYLNKGEVNLYTDSLFYDKYHAKSYLFKKYTLIDTVKRYELKGTFAVYDEIEKSIIATNRPLVKNTIDLDILYISADTFITFSDSLIHAYGDVRIFGDLFQGICNAFVYDKSKNQFTMRQEPVVWKGRSQMSADTIRLQMKKKIIKNIYLKGNSFILERLSRRFFNQIKGNYNTLFFKQNELDKMYVHQKSESIYYATEEKNGRSVFSGLNQSKSMDMWIYVIDKKIDRIKFVNNPKALFTPIKKVKKPYPTLQGFKNREESRPNSIERLNAHY